MKNQIAAHIKIVQHPNPEYRTFHVSRQISKAHGFDFGIDKMSFSIGDKEPGLLAKRLAKALEQLPGVTEGTIDGYEVSVMKGAAFSWDDIGPLVIGQIVKRVFPKCNGSTIEISTTISSMAGGNYHMRDMAKRCEVPVQFGTRAKWPQLDIEMLFKSSTLTKVVDNTGGESTPAASSDGKSAAA